MLRFAPIAMMMAACAPPDPGPTTQTPGVLPDAFVACVGAFQVVAPVADLHYDKSLDVYIDESEAQGDLQVTMIDDRGTSYTYTDLTFGTDPDGMYWSRDRYHFELAASHRYDLTVRHCDTSQTITFFTSP